MQFLPILSTGTEFRSNTTEFPIPYLIVVDLDLPEDVVLDEALEDGAVDLAEELARVHLELGLAKYESNSNWT